MLDGDAWAFMAMHPYRQRVVLMTARPLDEQAWAPVFHKGIDQISDLFPLLEGS